MHPNLRIVSQNRLLLKRLAITPSRPITMTIPIVRIWALTWVIDRPLNGRSPGRRPNSMPAPDVSMNLRCVSWIAFGSPVVPDVKMMAIVSFGLVIRPSSLSADAPASTAA